MRNFENLHLFLQTELENCENFSKNIYIAKNAKLFRNDFSILLETLVYRLYVYCTQFGQAYEY